jgi:DNA-binding response OmpR family regulator
MSKILLLEDESELREEVADYLRQQGHGLTEVASVRQFHQYFPYAQYDIVVIDRGLPDGDGLDLVEEVRVSGHRCGIVMFTARDTSQDRIDGYRVGADHYLTKPVRLEELGAVIQALSWRIQPPGHWWIDNSNASLVSPRGFRIKLTAQERLFLVTLGHYAPRALTRHQIATALGKDMAQYDTRSMDALVMRLRKKVSDHTNESLPILTHHGAGYSTPGNWTLSRVSA